MSIIVYFEMKGFSRFLTVYLENSCFLLAKYENKKSEIAKLNIKNLENYNII